MKKKPEYKVTAIVKATQKVSFDFEESEKPYVEYGSIDTIFENEETHLFDTANNELVAVIVGEREEENLAQELYEAVKKYERQQA